MKECIDIFSKLLIATITFVVPILINLLSSFTEGERRRRELAANSEDEISRRARENIQKNPGDLKNTVHESARKYTEVDKQTKSELNRLSPIIQFWWIFSFLAVSFSGLTLYYLTKSDKWGFSDKFSPTLLLVIAGVSYLIGLFFILRILYTVVKTKRIIDNNKN